MAGAVLAAAFSTAPATAADVSVIVGFHGRPDSSVFARHGGQARSDLGVLRSWAGRVPLRALAALRASPGVAFVEEDLVRAASLAPNDTLYAAQQADDYGLINCPAAWDVSTGAGVRVAVLDTGCQLGHPDIWFGAAGKIKIGKNFSWSGTGTNFLDYHGHGTHTAGTVGARTNNATGVAGAGFNCELAIGKVLSNGGLGFDSWIANGITWATDTAQAKVISMSLGGILRTATLENAVNYAWGKNVVLVAAAGNSGNTQPNYPASFPNCISVAAVDIHRFRAFFSNYGPTVDIAAPGVDIHSTWMGSTYMTASGTSMATPHVAGVAALVWATPLGSSNAAVRNQLLKNAVPIAPAPDGSPLSLLDAAAAVTVPQP